MAFAAPGQSQEWPQSTIRIIIAFGPGGGTDIVGRIIAQRMQEKLGQSVASKTARAPAASWATTRSLAPPRTATRSVS